jgi:hypothetical protein
MGQHHRAGQLVCAGAGLRINLGCWMGLALGRGAASLGRRWIGAAQGRGRRLFPDDLAARPIGPRRHHFIEVVEKIAKRGGWAAP